MSLASLSSLPKATQLAREELGFRPNQQMLQPSPSLKVTVPYHFEYFSSLLTNLAFQPLPHVAARVIFTQYHSGDVTPLLESH